MRRTLQLRLGEGVYFNPNFLQPDRIISSTELFTAVHHKRGNEVKGKWEESILMVTQKLSNFRKQGFPFGVVLQDPYP
jgi:hypothetical protein